MDNDAWRSMRASDADRERAADIVKAALAEGRITWEEHDNRLRQVLNGRTYGELELVTHDLPTSFSPPAPAGPPAVPAPHRAHPYLPGHRGTNGLAIVSIVCGGLGFMTGLSAIAAIITGHMALSQIKRTGEDGRGLAIAGLAMGYALTLGGLVLFLVIGTFLIAFPL